MKFLKTANAISTIDIQEESMEKGILIVDDSKFSRNILKDILKNEGFYVVAEAKNGLEAIEMTKEKKPKFIFMDVEMPMLDGLGAIPKVLEVDPTVHIIMCTAMGQKNIIVEAARAGAKDYVLKPYKKDNITRVLSAFIETQQKDGQVIPFKAGKRHQEEKLEDFEESTIMEEEYPEAFEEATIMEEVYPEALNSLEEIDLIKEDPLEAYSLELQEEPEVAFEEELLQALETMEEAEVAFEEELLQTLETMEELEAAFDGELLQALEITEETEQEVPDPVVEEEPEAGDEEEQEVPDPVLQAFEITEEPSSVVDPVVLEIEEEPEVALEEELLQEVPDPADEVPDPVLQAFEITEEPDPVVDPADEPAESIAEEGHYEIMEIEDELETVIRDEHTEVIFIEEEPGALDERVSEITVDSSQYSYLWANRFDPRLDNALNNDQIKYRIPFHNNERLADKQFGILESDPSNREILVGMISAYLYLGNRLQLDDTIFDKQIFACPEGMRLYTNILLEDVCLDKADITMTEVLKFSSNKLQPFASISSQKAELSNAVVQLVQGKVNRILGKECFGK